MTRSLSDTDDALNPLAQAAFEKSFEPADPDALGGARGAGLRVFIESPSAKWGAGFSLFAIGLRSSAGSGPWQSADALTQGFAAAARAELYAAGFRSPELSLNDFPAASYLLSADISCSQIALQPGPGMTRQNARLLAREAAQRAASRCFGRAAVSLPTSAGRDFDHRANEAIVALRASTRA